MSNIDKATIAILCLCVVLVGATFGKIMNSSRSEKCPSTGWEDRMPVGQSGRQSEIDAMLADNDNGCITPKRMRKVLHDLNIRDNSNINLKIDARLPDQLPPSSEALRDILTDLNK